MTPRITSPGPHITNTELTDFELRLGRMLPSTYGAFLLAHNGGVPDPSYVLANLPRGNDIINIQCFLSIGINNATNDVFVGYKTIFSGRGGLLPIADTDDGSCVCIGLDTANCGHIIYHDYYAGFDPPHPYRLGDRTNYFLYETFSEFISAFVSEE